MSAPFQQERPYLHKIINLQKLTSELDLQLHKQISGKVIENSASIQLIDEIFPEVLQLAKDTVVQESEQQYLNNFTQELRRLKAALLYYKENIMYDSASSATEELYEIIDESIIQINHNLQSITTIIRRQITDSDEKVLEGVQFIQNSLVFFLLIIICGTLIVFFVFNYILSANLHTLINGTIKLGEGKFDWRINSKFSDEFGMLSNAFDDMAWKIARAKREIVGQTKEIEKLAYYDSLTGLPNRFTFLDKLGQEVARAKRNNEKIGVLYIDLDQFKMVNDVFGHEVGDLLLKEVSSRLKKMTRLSDTVARLAGDEFTVILPQLSSSQDSAHIGQRILGEVSCPFELSQRIIEELSQPFDVNNSKLTVSSSIGIAIYPENGNTAEEILHSADTAMYEAKNGGKNRYKYCTEDMTKKMLSLVQTDQDIRQALMKDEFVLYYQPQIDLASKNLIGMEALVRWNHPQRGFIPPAEFIQIAEERGIIHDISKWVIRDVFNQFILWQEQGCSLVPVMVNLSARDFFQQGIEKFIINILQEEKQFQGLFGVEVTETGIMDDREMAIATLSRLRDLGVKIALDDFGTGYSSLNYLKFLPIDTVKIDRSFVRDITVDPKNAAICKAIIAMSHTLELKVLAEGIETPEQHEFVRNIHCDQAQGYLFSKPLSAEEMCKLLHNDSP